MESIIPKIIEVVVLLIALVIGRYVIPAVKSSVNMDKLDSILLWADKFVVAAENIVSGKKMGEEKLKLVTEWLTEKANSLGFILSEAEIRAIIEAAVAELNQ